MGVEKYQIDIAGFVERFDAIGVTRVALARFHVAADGQAQRRDPARHGLGDRRLVAPVDN